MNDSLDFLFVVFSDDFKNHLKTFSSEAGFRSAFISSPEEAMHYLNRDQSAVIWVEIKDEFAFGLELLEWLQSQNLKSELGILFHKNYEKSVSRAIHLGARHFISKHALSSPEFVTSRLKQSLHSFEENERLKKFEFKGQAALASRAWICATPQARFWLEDLCRKFLSHETLTLTGPKGAGKSYLADGLSLLDGFDYVLHWDCEKTPAFMQKQLFLNELKEKVGQGQGLIKIDEVGFLDLEIQEIVSELILGQGLILNSERVWPLVKVLFTATTHPSQLMDLGLLREDLLHLSLKNGEVILPLNQRKAEIKGLVNGYLDWISSGQKRINQEALDVLVRYDWPGEVLELKNLLDYLVKHVGPAIIEPQDLPEAFLVKNFYATLESEESVWELPYQEAKKKALDKFNKAYMKHLLDEAHQNYTVAAEKAGMDRSNFKKLLKKV